MFTSLLILQSLLGVWRQPCFNHSVKTESFTDRLVSLNESYFLDPQCGQPLMSFTSIGSYRTNDTTEPKQMDFQFIEVRIQLGHDRVVTDFNHRKVCGFSDWKSGEARNVTGKICQIFSAGSSGQVPKENEWRFGIYKLEANQLYFGKLTPIENALTPEARPTQWDPRFYSQATPTNN